MKTRRPVQHIVDNTEPPSFCPKCGQMHGFGERNGSKNLTLTSGVGRVDPSTFDWFAGVYRGPDGWTFTISREGERLLVQNGVGGPTFELFQIGENEFTAKEIPEIISFAKNGRGEVSHLIYNVEDIAQRVTLKSVP